MIAFPHLYQHLRHGLGIGTTPPAGWPSRRQRTPNRGSESSSGRGLGAIGASPTTTFFSYRPRISPYWPCMTGRSGLGRGHYFPRCRRFFFALRRPLFLTFEGYFRLGCSRSPEHTSLTFPDVSRVRLFFARSAALFFTSKLVL